MMDKLLPLLPPPFVTTTSADLPRDVDGPGLDPPIPDDPPPRDDALPLAPMILLLLELDLSSDLPPTLEREVDPGIATAV